MSTQKNVSTALSADLIRVIAIGVVILLHTGMYAANLNPSTDGLAVWRGWIINLYLCFGRLGVPLFIMLSGALLLAPSKKDEAIGVFFRKRFSRVGLPFLFWAGVYFLWNVFIEKQQVTSAFIINGVLLGPYIIFWYLYMLFGLYLITPLLRVMVANFTDKHFKYFIGLWLVGITLTSWVKFVSNWQYQIDNRP